MNSNNEQIKREGHGEGYDEREALQNWLTSDEFEPMGIGRGNAAIDTSYPVTAERVRKPKVAKRAHVDRTKQVGSRKWKTVYTAYNFQQHLHNKETDETWFNTQAEAISAAKKASLETKTTFIVTCHKQLVGSRQIVAEVTPGNSKPGKWHFSAMFNW